MGLYALLSLLGLREGLNEHILSPHPALIFRKVANVSPREVIFSSLGTSADDSVLL